VRLTDAGAVDVVRTPIDIARDLLALELE
jgi:hypothetical protein